jgi:glycosyltransferase involved in cell wall biosynthesis
MAPVDVVIAAYNAEATIAETLDSVLRQSLRPAAIIVVDDGSVDRTAELVEGYAKEFPGIVFLRQDNAGPSAARNRAIAAGRSPFIAPIDADDLWDETYLEQLVAALSTQPQAGFAYSHHRLIDEAGRVIRPGTKFFLSGECWGPMLLVNFVGNGSSAVFRRDAVEAVGGYAPPSSDWHGAEDYLLLLRVAASRPVTCVPLTLASYRKREGSLSTNIDLARDARINAVRLSLGDTSKWPLPVLRWVESDADRTRAALELRNGRIPRAVAGGWRGFRADPYGSASDLLRRSANLVTRLFRPRREATGRPDPLTLRRALLLQRAMPLATGRAQASPQGARPPASSNTGHGQIAR